MTSKSKLRLNREALVELESAQLSAIGGAEETASCILTWVCITVGDCQITWSAVC